MHVLSNTISSPIKYVNQYVALRTHVGFKENDVHMVGEVFPMLKLCWTGQDSSEISDPYLSGQDLLAPQRSDQPVKLWSSVTKMSLLKLT